MGWGLRVMGMNFSRGVIAAALVAFAWPTLAADIGGRPLPPPPESVYSWTGFYVGANVGIGVSNTPTNYSIASALPAFPAFDSGAASLIGGLQVGYNFQVGIWVFGAEADFQGSTIGSSDNCVFGCLLGQRLTHTTDLPWFGTVRGRIGTTMGGLLFYYTGGLAYGDVKTHVTENFGASSGTLDFTETRFGWTIGSGIEAALGGNWTGRAEYLYVDLGTTSNAFTLNGIAHTYSTDVQQHVFRLGLNYRFGADAQAAPPMMQPKRWSGFYAGFNFGNAVGRNPSTMRVGALADTFDVEPTGWFGGVQGGYNWQLRDGYVLGVEADIQGSGQNSDQNCALTCSSVASASLKQELPWWGTVRGRLGYTVGPSLFYVAGGLAYGQVKNKITETFPGFATASINSSETLTGWTFGGGLETPVGPILGMVFPNWTIRTEYLYIDLGNSVTNYTYAGVSHVLVSDIRNHVFRTSVNYQFSGP
jgi:outer membrane immunogenic protein